jgi:hypothetical protein
MTEAMAVIVGAVVGMVGGLAGGGFASLASLRASQLAARAPLGLTLSEISGALVRVRTSVAANDAVDLQYAALSEFEGKWRLFSIQQRILCPSERIENLMDLVRETTKREGVPSDALLNLAGQAVDKVTRMIGAHSNRLFSFKARKDEAKIIRRWLMSPESQILSDIVRSKLTALASWRR